MEAHTVHNRALTRQAQQDPRGFIARHFLDNQLRPDRSKTPSLLCVYHMDSPDGRSDLHQFAGAVEGLFHVQRTSNDGHTNMYLGWHPETPSRPIVSSSTAPRIRLSGPELTRLAERNPDALVKKFFLDVRGLPDHTKTELLVIPNMNSSSHRSHLHQAAGLHRGLHHLSGNTGGSTTMYLGWDMDAVIAAAYGSTPHPTSNRSAILARPIARSSRAVPTTMSEEESDREVIDRPEDESIAAQHDEYIRHATGFKSLVGRYLVDDSDSSWDDMALEIHETGNRGIYIAHFDLGEVSGTMIISKSDGVANSYRDREEFMENPNNDDDPSEDEETEEDEVTEQFTHSHNYGKRKALSTTSRPRKRVTRFLNEKTFHLKWRGREAGENMIILDYENNHSGILTTTSQYFKLTGEVEMGEYPGGRFTAYKVSDVPEMRPSTWSSFSEQAYEQESRDRWRR